MNQQHAAIRIGGTEIESMGTAKKSPKKQTSKRASSRKKVADVLNQVREPLSLLSTLRDEGLANANVLIGLAGALASGASRNFRMDAFLPQLRELVGTMGFALHADLEKLEARVEELELKISEREFAAIRASDDE